MKLRPFAAAAAVAAVALFGSACGAKDTPSSPGANAAEQQTADPKAELVAALDAASKQAVVKATMKVDEATVETQIDKANKLMTMKLGGSTDGEPFGLEMIVSGDDVYIKYTEGALADMMKTQMNGKEWIKTSVSKMGGEDPFQIGEVFDSAKLVPAGATVTKNGKEFTVANGGSGNVGGLLKGLTGGTKTEQPSDEPVSTTITLDDKGLIGNVKAKGTKPEQTADMSFTYSDKLDVKIPGDDEVITQ